MKYKMAFCVILFLVPQIYSKLFAQDLANTYEAKIFTSTQGLALPYRILYPLNYDKNQKYPLVVVLHGAGERGNDNLKQLTHGAKLFAADENRKKYPAIIIFPQCPAENYWGAVDIDRTAMPFKIVFDYRKPASSPLNAVRELINQIIIDEKIDSKRIYITGLSMGGMGTFEAVHRYPKLFAAAMPICGGGDAKLYTKKARKVPFWAFHGDADVVVKVMHSREMVDRLTLLGFDIKYTEYPGVNHNSWDNAFAEQTFLSWMFSNKK